MAISDAGFFPDLPNLNGEPAIRALYQVVFNEQNASAGVNKACLEAKRAAGEPEFECFMAQYSLPHTKTPFFALNSAYDSWAQKGILQRRMPPGQGQPLPQWNNSCDENLSNCNATQLRILEQYRAAYLQVLKQVTDPDP